MSFSHKDGDNEVSGDFSKLEKIIENLGKKHYVDIGILGGAGATEGGLTLAGIGAVHEFGTDKAGRGNSVTIPERSFIKMPLETGQDYIESQIEPRLAELMEAGDIEGIFKLIGIAGEARIKEAFASGGFGTWPENAPATVRQKGSGQPLIDQGALQNGITSRTGK